MNFLTPPPLSKAQCAELIEELLFGHNDLTDSQVIVLNSLFAMARKASK